MWGLKTIRGVVLILCGIESLVHSASNCTLKIIQNDSERTDLSCIEYHLPPSECRLSNNPNLPIVDQDNAAIEKAKNFQSDADRLVEDIGGVTWNLPRLHLSWNLPESSYSVTNLKGFIVDGVCVDGACPNSDFCIMFQVSGFTSLDYNVQFQYVTVLNISTTYYELKLYTLPRTLTDRRLLLSHYRDIRGASNNAPTKESAKWTTSPKLEFTENNLTLSFKYPEFDLTHFNISLKGSDRMAIKSKMNVRVEGSTHAEVSFTNIPSGKYFIDIEPRDQRANDMNNCQCYTLFDGVYKECNPCGSVRTSWFNITAPALPPTSTSPTTTTTTAVDPVKTSSELETTPVLDAGETPTDQPHHTDPNIGEVVKPEEDDTMKIGLAIGLTLLMFSLGTVALVYYVMKCRKRGDEDPASLQEKSSFEHFKEVAIEEKTVFVLSADDHANHLDVVKQLVMFLKDKCQCRVIYPPWEIKQMSSSTWREWFRTSLDQADYVLVVNSEASYRLFKAASGNKSYKYKFSTDSAHLFIEMLTEILKEYKKLENVHHGVQTTSPDMDNVNRLDIDKFITVSFSYTPKEYYFTDFRMNFELLQQLPNLIRYIHKLQANSHIPLDLKDVFTDVPDNDCKADLENAELKARKYQKSNVLWFSDHFGDACRRETNRHDSGYDEQEDISRSRSSSEKSGESVDEMSFFPPSIISDDKSRVTAPDATETMSNFSFIPPDAVSRGLSEFCAPTDLQDDEKVCTISRQFRDMNTRYEDNIGTKV